jgi:hypothetical protein
MVTPSAVKTARGESPDHKMLGAAGQIATRHWLYDMGWTMFFENETISLTRASEIRCVGSKHPRLVDGEVQIERCGRWLPIPPAWNVVMTRHWAPLFMLCWQHASQSADFAAMYDRMSAEA